MQVEFVDGNPQTIKIVLDTNFSNREEALNKMDDVHKEFKRVYSDRIILVILQDPAVDVHILG